MTQTLPPESTTEAAPSSPAPPVGDGFDYHPMPVLVPIAAVLALGSLLAFLGLIGIVIGVVAVPVAILAWWKVRSSEGFYSGGGLAKASLVLALVGLIGGSAWQRQMYLNEVPEGFRRVNFSYDISKKPVAETPTGVEVPDDVAELEGREIFIKGYMYPQQQTEDLRAFLLLKDTGECCFGGQPKVTDMIGVEMEGDLRADHHDLLLVSVAGTFHINHNYGRPNASGDPKPLYHLDATHFEIAKTQF